MKNALGAVRNVAVSYSNFVDDSIQLLSLFDDVEKIDKEERLQTAIDTIQNQLNLQQFKRETLC